jgi:hypothetical protein
VEGVVLEPFSDGCVVMASEYNVVRQCGHRREVLDGPWTVDFVRSPPRLFAGLDPAASPPDGDPIAEIRALEHRCTQEASDADCARLGATNMASLTADQEDVWVILRGLAVRLDGRTVVEMRFHGFPDDPSVRHHVEGGLALFRRYGDVAASVIPGQRTSPPAATAPAAAPPVEGCYRRIGGDEEICFEPGRLAYRHAGKTVAVETSGWEPDSRGGLKIQLAEDRLLLVRDWGPMTTIVQVGPKRSYFFGDFFVRRPRER